MVDIGVMWYIMMSIMWNNNMSVMNDGMVWHAVHIVMDYWN